jgi:signal transduction histidine kinase/ligand-binding sensor domain-containing protein/CheY-like chemotaxis protein
LRLLFSLGFISFFFFIELLNFKFVLATDYKVKLLNADNGFTSSVIFSIVQDDQGFLWFGSGHQGLFRYDGKNIKRFKHDPKNPSSLPHNNTGNLTIDSDNNLWIGSWGGSVIKYNLATAKFSQYNHISSQTNTVSDQFVQKIFQDNQGDYWMGTNMSGLNKYNKDNNTFTRFPYDVNTGNGTFSARIWDIIQTNENSLWIATDYGLNHLDKSTSQFSYFIPEPGNVLKSSNKIRKILATNNDSLIVASDDGVLLFDIAQQIFIPVQEATNKSIGEVYSIIKTSFDQYWVASASGIYAFTLENLVLEKVNLGINDDCSQTLFEDRERLIWLTCEGVGVYKITPNKYFHLKNTSYFRTVRDLNPASDNSIYLTSPTLGIREWFPETNTLTAPFPKTDKLRSDMLMHSKEGDVLVRGAEKLYSINKAGNITPIKLPSKLQSLALAEDFITFRALKKDKYTRLWIGTEKGLFIIDNRSNDYFYFGNHASSNPTFKHAVINQIYRDRDDKMWVGTPDGLYLWNEVKKELRSFDFTSENTTNIQKNFINTLYQDQQKRIWVGSKKGLYLVNKKAGSSNLYNVNTGLADDNVQSITEDNVGNLWLLTDVGLSRFNPITMNFQNFDHQDGLSDSRSYNQLIKTNNGTLYFSSREGLHFFHPESLKKQSHNANTVLTNFEVLGSPTEKKIYTPSSSEFNLAYDENYLKFEFATIVHADARQVNYFYKLEGFDKEWINNGNNNTAIYTNLNGGDYTFKVRSTYRKNEWYKQVLAVDVNIATPFWLTWWMYVIYGGLSLLLLQRYMKRKSFKQQQIIEQQKSFVIELEIKVAEKTASIAQESYKLAQANKIKSQFLANMSHEIRTPLNAVIGLSNIALRNETNQTQADYLHKIHDSSQSLLSLINGILDLSKIESKKLSLEYLPFNLDLLITKTVNICSYKAHEKNLELIIDIADDVKKELIGDQLRLQQILINLVHNAIKFTEKGLVYLSVESVSSDQEHTTLQFSITDTGIGMNLAKQTHLFDAFAQADDTITKKYGGTGLGLTISKQLIELMNGKISVRSELTKGSVFTFTATFYSAEDNLSNHSKNQKYFGESLKVMVADSNDIVGNIMMRILNRVNIFPDYVANNQETIKQILLAEKSDNPYELIILDWKMFKLGVADVAIKAQQECITNLPHIFVGNCFDNDECKTATQNSFFKGFIEKPIIPSTFIESLTRLLPTAIQKIAVKQVQADIPQLQHYSVLLVEDNILNQLVAKTFLADTNIQIDCAEDGEIAINKIKSNTYDIILMDIQMPNMDGLTAASIIRNDLKLTKLPIIAMTAHAMEGDAQKSKQIGMNEHLTKPISPEKLYEILVKYLQ